MVNVPSNFRNMWADIAKDNKIDSNEYKKLTENAKSGEDVAFLNKLSGQMIKDGAKGCLNIKNGSATGSFDFVSAEATTVSKTPTTVKTNNVSSPNPVAKTSSSKSTGASVAYIPVEKSALLAKTLGYSSVSELQTAIGLKGKDVDNKFGPVTLNAYLNALVTEAKGSTDKEFFNNCVEILNFIKNDKQIMKSKSVSDALGQTSQVDNAVKFLHLGNLEANVNNLFANVSINYDSLTDIRNKVTELFNKLPADVKNSEEAKVVLKTAFDKIDEHLTPLSIEGFANKVNQIIDETNKIEPTTKDTLMNAKKQITDVFNKLPDAVKSSSDIKSIIDKTFAEIDSGIKQLDVKGFSSQIKTVLENTDIYNTDSLNGAKKQIDAIYQNLPTELKDVKEIKESYQVTKDFDPATIKEFENKVNALIDTSDKSSLDSLKTLRGKVEEMFKGLADGAKATKQAQDIAGKAMERIFTSVENLFKADVNKFVEGVKTEILKNGQIDSSASKKGLDEIVSKYVDVMKDPVFGRKDIEQNIKTASSLEFDKAIKETQLVINKINTLTAKPDWTNEELTVAKELSNNLPSGKVKDKLDTEISIHEKKINAATSNKLNMETTVKGLHDVIGNGWFNLENKEGTKGMLQLVAKQNLLGDALTEMNIDDQVRAVKILLADKNTDKFDLAIAKTIFESLSNIADVSKKFDRESLMKLKGIEKPEKFDLFKLNEDSLVKGLKFSIGSEKEAALTMARGIINNEIPSSVLSKFDKDELKNLVDIVKKANPLEKDELLKQIADLQGKGSSVNTENFETNDKARVIKEAFNSSETKSANIDKIIEKADKKTIFSLVENERLSDKELAKVAKNVDGDKMADKPLVATKLLTAMIKTFIDEHEIINNKISVRKDKDETLSQKDMENFISQIDKDWFSDDDVMKMVLSELGSGKDSLYDKARNFFPKTLDKMWNISN